MKNSKSKLGNPLVAAAAVEKTAEAIPFLIKFFTVVGTGAIVYMIYSNRFIKRGEVASYGPANITEAQAQSRAAAIYAKYGLFGNDFDNVAAQIAGLNYNGFIRVFNAFGKKTGTLLGGELDLEQWCRNQFSDYQVKQLSFLLGGAFFQ